MYRETGTIKYTRGSVKRKICMMNRRGRKRIHKLIEFVFLLSFILFLGSESIAYSFLEGAYNGAIDSVSEIGTIDITPKSFPSYLYDSEGNEITKLSSADSNRTIATSDMIPENLKNAFVAIEDERFYQHHGIDYIGIARAAKIAMQTKTLSQGASTITQQLIKNTVYPDFESETKFESIRRKIQEQAIAQELEKRMSKEEILVDYMNIINLGHGAFGVWQAAKTYFNKNVSDLSLSECAVIACITQNPSAYDPFLYPENNKRRKDVTLDKMLELGMISKKEHDEAISDDVYSRLESEKIVEPINSYFTDAVIQDVINDLQKNGYSSEEAHNLLYSGGLKIYTTQNQTIQKICDTVANDESMYPAGTTWYLTYSLSVLDQSGKETAYTNKDLQTFCQKNNLSKTLLFRSKEQGNDAVKAFKQSIVHDTDTIESEIIDYSPQPQLSMTVEDQETGRVLAMVGGRGEKKANMTWNRATDTTRQPGSTFKVVGVFAPALEAGGKTLASTELDEPFSYDNGIKVRNWWGNYYRGYQSVRDAIRESMNIVSVKNLQDITPELGYQYLEKMGISTLVDGKKIEGKTYTDKQLSLALGGLTLGVKNIELNGAYATIANGGKYIKPHLYTEVVAHDGKILLKADEIGEKVLKKSTAWLLTNAMEDVVTGHGGTARTVKFSDMPIAGKTGTTSNNVDEWFCGYTPYYTMSVWTGYDENSKLNSTELKYAKNIWKTVMSQLCEGKEVKDFTRPTEVVQMSVCKNSGLLPTSRCSVKTEYFDVNSVPTEYCNLDF